MKVSKTRPFCFWKTRGWSFVFKRPPKGLLYSGCNLSLRDLQDVLKIQSLLRLVDPRRVSSIKKTARGSFVFRSPLEVLLYLKDLWRNLAISEFRRPLFFSKTGGCLLCLDVL